MCYGLNKIKINIFAIKRSKGLVKFFLMAFFYFALLHSFKRVKVTLLHSRSTRIKKKEKENFLLRNFFMYYHVVKPRDIVDALMSRRKKEMTQ